MQLEAQALVEDTYAGTATTSDDSIHRVSGRAASTRTNEPGQCPGGDRLGRARDGRDHYTSGFSFKPVDVLESVEMEYSTLLFMMPGGPELVIIFLVAVLLFGSSKLPQLARAAGESMGEFQKGRESVERELREMRRAPEAEVESGSQADSSSRFERDSTIEAGSVPDPNLNPTSTAELAAGSSRRVRSS